MIEFIINHSKTITSVFELHQFPSWELQTPAQWEQLTDKYLGRVAVLWEQVESTMPNPIKDANQKELYRRLPPNCRKIRFPAFYFLTLWPFYAGDVRQAHEPLYTAFRYPFGDAVAAELAGSDLPDDDLFAAYIEKSTASLPDLARKLEFEEMRMRDIDESADLKATDWILNNFQTQRIFNDPQHCSSQLLKLVALQMADQTLAGDWVDGNAAKAELTDLFDKHRGLNPHELPIHPAVIDYFKLPYADSSSRYQWVAHSWTFKDYMIKYMRYADYCVHY